jgi:DNA modification methylase
MNCQIINSDCLEALSKMPEASVECIVTSPPYGNLRTYGGFKWDFEVIAKELFRVLVSGGVLCWNVADQVVDGSETLTSFRQGLYFVDEVGFRMHDRMIYEKLNFSHPEKNRYHQVFEDIFILSKNAPRVFNPIKDKKNSTAGQIGNLGVNTFTEADGSKSVREKKVTAEFGMRHNVWKGKTRGQEDMCEVLPHPAMMPKWLARDLILSWSNHGDTVLDPFAGSGTTGKMALEVGRNAILIDSNPEYIPIIHNSTKVQYGLNLA